MPNYSTIIHADQNVYSKVQDADMFLCIYPIKDQNANPAVWAPLYGRTGWRI